MAIYRHYVDNVSGATGNGGTGPSDAHFYISQAIAGISNGGYDAANDLSIVYVKSTGVTYSEEGIDIASVAGYEIKVIGTNSSFVEDGSRPMVSNASDYFMRGAFGGRLYFSNVNFNTTYTNGITDMTTTSYLSFAHCDLEGNDLAQYASNTSNNSNVHGTHVNCSFRNFTASVHQGTSNRQTPHFVYCYLKNADPWRAGGGVGDHWIVNCVLEDSHLQDSHYDEKHIVNTLFYGSNGSNPQLYIGDRTSSGNYHVVVNNAFVDAPGYAVSTLSTRDAETYLFYNNFFHGAVSGNFNMANNFDPANYYGITTESGDPSFVDEIAGGSGGFVPLSTSSMSNIGVWNTDVGPLKAIFTTSDVGEFSLGTGGVGDTVTVSGRSYQKIDDSPIVWRTV